MSFRKLPHMFWLLFELPSHLQVCHALKEAIDSSPLLRYKTLLSACGMRDGPDQSLSLNERIQNLQAYDEARRTLSFTELKTFPLPLEARVAPTSDGSICFIRGGDLQVYTPPSRLRGISAKMRNYHFPVAVQDVGIDPERDLLIAMGYDETT
jgi:hypothetical protein